MDTSEIRQYAKLLQELGLTALEVRADGTVRLERTTEPPVSALKTAPADSRVLKATEQEKSTDGSVVTSPMIGMFYIAPSENADPFVKSGSAVHKGDVLCIIESMKLMNEITADFDGEVLEVLAVNGAVVEFGQPLFKVKKDIQ